jgi:hypothetical protein
MTQKTRIKCICPIAVQRWLLSAKSYHSCHLSSDDDFTLEGMQNDNSDLLIWTRGINYLKKKTEGDRNE